MAGGHDGGNRQVVGVGALAPLEVDVGILRRAAQLGMLGVHRLGAERGQLLPVHKAGHVLVVDHLDLLHLVGGPEAVEEVQEGDARLQRRQMGDQGQVHAFLDRGGAEQGEAGGGGPP